MRMKERKEKHLSRESRNEKKIIHIHAFRLTAGASVSSRHFDGDEDADDDDDDAGRDNNNQMTSNT